MSGETSDRYNPDRIYTPVPLYSVFLMLPAHHTSRLFFRCHSVSLRTSRVGYLPGYYSCVALFLPDCNCTCYTIDSYQLFLSIFHTIVSSRLFLCIFYTIVSSGRFCTFSIPSSRSTPDFVLASYDTGQLRGCASPPSVPY